MKEQRECRKCDGSGTDYLDRKVTCSDCGGRGWRIMDVSDSNNSNNSGPEPLLFKSITSIGIVIGVVMGGYFGWCVGGIGGALTYGAIAAVVFGFCAALFSAFLRILIKITIGIGILIAINLLWGKGKKEEVGSNQSSISFKQGITFPK
jgi:hypothetical protein